MLEPTKFVRLQAVSHASGPLQCYVSTWLRLPEICVRGSRFVSRDATKQSWRPLTLRVVAQELQIFHRVSCLGRSSADICPVSTKLIRVGIHKILLAGVKVGAAHPWSGVNPCYASDAVAAPIELLNFKAVNGFFFRIECPGGTGRRLADPPDENERCLEVDGAGWSRITAGAGCKTPYRNPYENRQDYEAHAAFSLTWLR